MRVTCPCCGAMHELDTLVQHEYARKTVVAAAELPPSLFAQTMRYLRLFVSPNAPQRALTMDRAATLLDALVRAINAGSVDAKGRAWSAPLAVWPAAFDAVFSAVDDKRRKLPLTNHGYLFGCIANMADATEAKTEAATEAQRRAGPVLNDAPPATSTDDPPPIQLEASRGIPAEALAVMASFTARKSMTAAVQSGADEPARDPLLDCMASVIKGKWKGKGGKIVRVAGEQIYVAIQFPRNGLQTIPFNRTELEL